MGRGTEKGIRGDRSGNRKINETDAGGFKNLIIRCERLKQAIDSLEESARKVCLKKLRMCRKLQAFVSKGQYREIRG
jgi:hypothetical protein